ncbi:preprotein translocase subunit SecD [Methanococcus voltae]|uniref:Protein-export membrane protein SecD n=2 Tax=Methanococcus voltae TaxID=2188 RepID=A0A8J7S3K5_METVO|nr:preprotein translocase subunit SecD [Methanococcus voltae]MBP2172163.1 preprotein translocase subunit SecD [Methanococcus voltae]MBP2200880.1 preprotein translocase subunit SecD [Methanococcus voltae]MCS3921604.1 preprotein translocase subunit SecD [Methanococcus voltae PS]
MKLLKDKKVLFLLVCVVASILAIVFNGISFGVDLSGGSTIVLQTEKPVTEQEMGVITEILTSRLNTNGLSDVNVYSRGSEEIAIEIPESADLERIKKVIAQQGVFYATIDNVTAYTGKDVEYVEEPALTAAGYGVSFKLSATGADNFANVSYGKGGYKVNLYLDEILISDPVLSPDLADGKPHPSQVITVAGSNPTKDDEDQAWAIYTALKSGSLPVKVNIAYINSISPTLGEEFIKSSIIAGIIAFLAVATVIGIRYKTPKIVLPILITGASEVLLILGFASIIGWKLDLAAIAGIIATLGTSVDHQIVITDETLAGESKKVKRSIQRAFFIIFGAAATTIAAMSPLFLMSIGMLKGFAITTIAGVLFGVFISRPAFARIIRELLRKY